MERMVLEVALKGDVASLKKLLEEDPLILERCMVSVYSNDTPLHVAAMLGYEDFANEILRRKPELAKELNSNQSSPLHLAAAMGHAGVVRALLLVDRGMLKGRDRDGLTPFHLAAVKGRVEVLKEMMSDDDGEICSSELSEVMAMDGEKLGESILQMCVKYGQLEALKLLVEMIADRDGGEGVKFLVQRSGIQVNNGKEIGGGRENSEKYKKKKESWINEMREGLMVAASLLATMAFQAIVSPPGGLLSETRVIEDAVAAACDWFSCLFGIAFLIYDNDNNDAAAPAPAPTYSDKKGYIGESVMSYYQPIAYQVFVVANTLSFLASLSVIMLLISGLPLHRKFFMYVMMITMWVAITAAGFSYVTCLQMITASSPSTWQITYMLTLTWGSVFAVLAVLIGAGYVIKVTVAIIKWLPTLKNKKKKKKNSSSSMLLHQV
ncbi:ankyrin repeat-containing protein ITN1-like [Ipomoea triloba]|uniref:ankyrin repeat-containing protein ITN1-like n=1 Tax=Ipomoea triloba TaxID=35885 RepID=UPI00125D592B|nr:ankyrin repeat-containing protein ITN1-like [Ipomoea triloba]